MTAVGARTQYRINSAGTKCTDSLGVYPPPPPSSPCQLIRLTGTTITQASRNTDLDYDRGEKHGQRARPRAAPFYFIPSFFREITRERKKERRGKERERGGEIKREREDLDYTDVFELSCHAIRREWQAHRNFSHRGKITTDVRRRSRDNTYHKRLLVRKS